jgi:hypothetical protein
MQVNNIDRRAIGEKQELETTVTGAHESRIKKLSSLRMTDDLFALAASLFMPMFFVAEGANVMTGSEGRGAGGGGTEKHPDRSAARIRAKARGKQLLRRSVKYTGVVAGRQS